MRFLNNLISIGYTLSIFFCASVCATAHLSGEFKQSKHFAGFSKPFVSEGVFTLEDKKLNWHVMKPVESTLLIENGHVFVKNNEGKLEPQPGSEQFVGLLTDLLAMDIAALQARFDVTEQEECLILIPKDTLLSQLFSNFILCENNKRVNSLTLNEHAGSNTLIEFYYKN